MNALPVEGWYADSEDPGLIRWWDGSQWTSRTRPAATAQTAPTPEPGNPVPSELPVIPDLLRPDFGRDASASPVPDQVTPEPAELVPSFESTSEPVSRPRNPGRRSGHPTPEDYRRRVEELQQVQPPATSAPSNSAQSPLGSWAAAQEAQQPRLVTEPASAFTPPDSPDEGAVIVSARTQAPENDLLASMGYVFAVLAPPVGLVVSIALFIKGDERARYVLGVAILFCIIGLLFFL